MRSLSSVLFAAGLFFVASPSRAADPVTLAFVPDSFHRYSSTGEELQRAYAAPFERGLTGSDCDEDTSLGLMVERGGACPDCSIETWAGPEGVDCSDLDSRRGPVQKCWPVAARAAFGAGRFENRVRVQDVLSGLGRDLQPREYVPATKEACQREVVGRAPQGLALWVLVPTAGSVVAYARSSRIEVRISQPPAPGIEEAFVDRGQVSVRIPAAAKDAARHTVYCLPVEAAGGASCAAGDEGHAVPGPAPDAAFACAELAAEAAPTVHTFAAPSDRRRFVLAVGSDDGLGAYGPTTMWSCPLGEEAASRASCSAVPGDGPRALSSAALLGLALVGGAAAVRGRRRGRSSAGL